MTETKTKQYAVFELSENDVLITGGGAFKIKGSAGAIHEWAYNEMMKSAAERERLANKHVEGAKNER